MTTRRLIDYRASFDRAVGSYRGPLAPGGDARATAELGGRAALPGRISVRFAWSGEGRPGVRCPALGEAIVPMRADYFGGWEHEADLPLGAHVSWGIVPDLGATDAAVGTAIAADRPVLPSPERMLGAEPGLALGADLGVIATPGAPVVDWSRIGRPVAAMRTVRLRDGRRLVLGPIAAPPSGGAPRRRALILDGEVARRFHRDLAAAGASLAYLDNLSAGERRAGVLHDSAATLAAQIAPHFAPTLVVGTSETAAAAIRLALELGATTAALVSPVFADGSTLRSCIRRALADGLAVRLLVGSEERDGPERPLPVRRGAEIAAELLRAGSGVAELAEFAGGHDLAAWRGELARAIEVEQGAARVARRRSA